MKFTALAFLCLNGCAALSYRALETQDCITTHLKAMTRNNQTPMAGELYDKIVESCQSIFGGRP